MSYLPSFGPTTFDIDIGELESCIQLTPLTDPPDGTYSMLVGDQGTGDCSNCNLQEVGTVKLDEDGNVVRSHFKGKGYGGHFGEHKWVSMTGTFNSDGTGGGTITNDDPTKTEGVWAAGGGGEPFFPKRAHA